MQQPGPSRAAPCRRRAPGTGVKNIEGRVPNRTFKIKKLITVSKNIEAKKNGQVVKKWQYVGEQSSLVHKEVNIKTFKYNIVSVCLT